MAFIYCIYIYIQWQVLYWSIVLKKAIKAFKITRKQVRIIRIVVIYLLHQHTWMNICTKTVEGRRSGLIDEISHLKQAVGGGRGGGSWYTLRCPANLFAPRSRPDPYSSVHEGQQLPFIFFLPRWRQSSCIFTFLRNWPADATAPVTSANTPPSAPAGAKTVSHR